jgi:hypothetical protein
LMVYSCAADRILKPHINEIYTMKEALCSFYILYTTNLYFLTLMWYNKLLHLFVVHIYFSYTAESELISWHL